MLCRRICRNFVAGFPQTAFDGRPKGRVIIDDVNNTRHDISYLEITAKADETCTLAGLVFCSAPCKT
jgi:hypothetical protein